MADECSDPIDLFRTEALHDDPEVQMRAIKRLPTLAVALDVDRTRHELIGCLEQYVNDIYCQNVELLVATAEQLGKFTPFIGGAQYSHILFPMLEKLAAIEEPIGREKAVESLQNIASLMDTENLEAHFVPLIERLYEADWFTSKCSAASLIPIAYSRLTEEGQTKLRNLFAGLLKDESPMVRRAAATSFTELIKIIDIEYLKGDCVAIYKQMAEDEQDSVRLLAVNIGIAIASRLNGEEIEDIVLETLEKLCADPSWRIRYQFANEINSIQIALGPKITRKHVIPFYRNLIRDTEANIREISAKNIVQFCEILQTTYKASDEDKIEDLDPTIKNEILPLIKELDQDINEEVKDGLYSVITSLGSLLGQVNTRSFLLPLITSSIDSDSSRIKESIVSNLNNIMSVIGVEDLTEAVEKLMTDLVNNSLTIWRTRRNLIVTISHMAKHSKKEYFNEHLRSLYVKLLNDAVYGVRKVASLVLPIFAKNFGMSWAVEFIIPTFIDFAAHPHYLFRQMCLFGIDELIAPTLDKKKLESREAARNYLDSFRQTAENSKVKAARALNKINILSGILEVHLQEEWTQIVLDYIEDDHYFNDDIASYAEQTIKAFSQCYDSDIIPISASEIENEETEVSYLEGLLFLIIIKFLFTVHSLAEDKVVNVRMRAANTLQNVVSFNRKLNEEFKQDWVLELMEVVPRDEAEKIKTGIQKKIIDTLQKNCETKRMEVNDASVDEIFNGTDSGDHEEIPLNKIEPSITSLDSIEEAFREHQSDLLRGDANADAAKEIAKSEDCTMADSKIFTDVEDAGVTERANDKDTTKSSSTADAPTTDQSTLPTEDASKIKVEFRMDI